MKHFYLFLVVGGLFYTTLNTSLADITKADCRAGIQAACVEVAKW